MSESYQEETYISLEDVHYSPLCPGERELCIIGDVRGKRVLELACGGAQNSIALAKWGASATAIDISREQLSRAKSLAEREAVQVNLLQGDIEKLGMFKDCAFDLLISCFGLEFLPEPSACLRECYRVLDNGGVLVIGTVHPLTAFEWDEEAAFLCVTDYFNPPVEVWNEPSQEEEQKGVTFFRTYQEMFSLLLESGFQVEQVIEPAPYAESDAKLREAPYGGAYWETQRERVSKVPFAIVYKARKPSPSD